MRTAWTWATLLPVLAAAACATPPPRPASAPSPVFVPQAFFAGRTLGAGSLKIVFSRARPTHVVGTGRVEPDGTLVLAQRIEEDGKPPRTRTWRLGPERDGVARGALTDAVGPVVATVRGNLLRVRYAAKGGLRVDQRLVLRPGGRVADNRTVVRKFGVPVAVLRETIRKE